MTQKLNSRILWILSFLIVSCVGDDFIDDRVDERISITNPIQEIQVNNTHQLNATFFNNVGLPTSVDFTWFSSNPMVAEVSSSGLLTALSEGETLLRVSVALNSGTSISEETTITVTSEPVDLNDPITKSGTIVTTSSYTLTGNFTLSEIVNTDNLNLQIDETYQASTSLPGLYLYLSNNPNSISGALELGPVQVFNGAHSYEITNTHINEYKYLLYWCKPFSVKVGEGEIND